MHACICGSLCGLLRMHLSWLQEYWAREPGMYRPVSVREFADAYARSEAGLAQTEALLKPFKRTKESDRALSWTKFALTGAFFPRTLSLQYPSLLPQIHWSHAT